MLHSTIQAICRHCGTSVVNVVDSSASIRGPEWETSEGTPSPLGVTWLESEQGYNFAIDTVNASKVTLLLYLGNELRVPCYSLQLDQFKNKSGPVWHCRVPISEAGDAVYYAYQIDGPAAKVTDTWHAFDPEKVLLDPYARSVFFPAKFKRDAARLPGPNGGSAPLGRLDVCRCPFDWGNE